MAFSINGFGTTFYGERDLLADHSYVTTEWIVVAHIPLIPIRSLRVKATGDDGSTSQYGVIKSGLPNWRQVFSTYALMAFSVGWIWSLVLGGMKAHAFFVAKGMATAGLILGCGIVAALGWIPAIIPNRLRDRAERRAGLNGYR